MSSIPAPADARRARRIHYVDERIQKWLLVALVVLEVILAGAAVAVLAWRLSGVIDENLYRVHLAEAEPLLGQLTLAAVNVLVVFVAVNVVAVLAADAIWRYYVNSVVHDFMVMIGKTGELDFSPDPEATRHEVLALASAWRARERARLDAIRVQAGRLDAGESTGSNLRSMRDALNRLDELLPRAWGDGQ